MKLDRIKEIAKSRGRSLSWICSQLGVNRVYFIDIAKSGRSIPADKLEIIASCLETTPEYLLYETDDPNPKEKEPVEALDELEQEVISILRGMSVEQKLHLVEFLRKK